MLDYDVCPMSSRSLGRRSLEMEFGGGRKRGRPEAAYNGNGGMKKSKQGCGSVKVYGIVEAFPGLNPLKDDENSFEDGACSGLQSNCIPKPNIDYTLCSCAGLRKWPFSGKHCIDANLEKWWTDNANPFVDFTYVRHLLSQGSQPLARLKMEDQ